ncbi:hypothetical protein Hbl1158_14375 [Halobaculum sp. CBA1158]|uniref:ArsR/SmtB family transcription factor n=1 Tax=Halobaculum sp. CBA1158 TaxID=2904243 RepID=UPI001F46827D|nr:hypothetical protein [Halobaculum sp. CBA1158]UIO99691.1 hypothetical protein Hbl1158_14375 [Halobaculum sp. CBA1158]
MNQHTHSIAADAVLRLLSDHQRRGVLRRLADADEPVSVESLTAALVTESTTADAVRIRLLHSHLPKLHDAGVIDYDADERTVRRGPEFEPVASLLQALSSHLERASETPLAEDR